MFDDDPAVVRASEKLLLEMGDAGSRAVVEQLEDASGYDEPCVLLDFLGEMGNTGYASARAAAGER